MSLPDSLTNHMHALTIKASPKMADAQNNSKIVVPKNLPLSPSEDDFSENFERILQLRTEFHSERRASDFSKQYSGNTITLRFLEMINLYDCPAIVWYVSGFPSPMLDMIRTLRFEYSESFGEILHSYEAATTTSIHWRAVLEMGRELIAATYDTCKNDAFPLRSGDLDIYRGPSRSLEEFEVRKNIWKVKKEVWEAVIEFADSPLQQSLDDLMLPGGSLDLALLEEERHGLFQPWNETPECLDYFGDIEHTKDLPNPFDPIMLGGVSLTEIQTSHDF